MPVFKFWINNDNNITLDNFFLYDISKDTRSVMIPKSLFKVPEFKIDKSVYMFVNDKFFELSKKFELDKEIDAILLKDGNDVIIAIKKGNYVFWDGKSIEPVEYIINDKLAGLLDKIK